jgi:hypothetical protein
MKRLITAFVSAALATAALTPTAFAFTSQASAASQALTYLHSLQSSDGTIAGDSTRTEETVWGLAANNVSITAFSTAGHTTVDSLSSHISSEEKTAGAIGSLILAVTAAGLPATDFAGHNLLQDLACTYNSTTGAFNDQLYNDALAVLSIPAGKAPAKSIDFLIGHQQANGGWEFGPGFGSDTNTTSLVLMALKSAGSLSTIVTTRALAYLKTQQQASGGFQYAAGSGDSDPDSDGLVIEGLLAAGEDPTSAAWSLAGKNAVLDLLSFQYQNGGFGYSRPGSGPSAAPDPLSTTQPLVGLASRFLPVSVTTGAFPLTCPSAAASATPTPGPSTAPTSSPATTTVRLAQTGDSSLPSLPLLFAGTLAVLAGLKLRRQVR